MPSRNTVKEYAAPAFYHVYNRGAGERNIFTNENDKMKFMSLLERHLTGNNLETDEQPHKIYNIELIAYCLMNSHFHLLFFQPDDPNALTGIMRSVSTAYSMYFNKRYKSQGHLFQSIYKASYINNDAYLSHITRYIHLNPRTYKTYHWSSLPFYIGNKHCDWIHPERINDMSADKYMEFLEDYEDRKKVLEEIKDQLAL
jgi:putative transposase